MLAYLILSSRNRAPIDPELIRRFDRNDLPGMPIAPDERIVWRNQDETVVFIGWQALTSFA